MILLEYNKDHYSLQQCQAKAGTATPTLALTASQAHTATPTAIRVATLQETLIVQGMEDLTITTATVTDLIITRTRTAHPTTTAEMGTATTKSRELDSRKDVMGVSLNHFEPRVQSHLELFYFM